MLIVPDGDALTVEARVAPNEIDRVRAGQPAFLRLTAFDQRRAPEVTGEVTQVSADLSTDQRSGSVF